MPAIATYPGTVTPLRGLSAFAESERDVFFGRDRERDEMTRLIIGEGFRAGLLYGEPGVGKTSLLRAGLVPHLRDHGVIALVCDDPANPVESFAQAVMTATGLGPNENERSITYLARVVGQALSGQLYLFIIDEVDAILRQGDDRVIGELGDLFARVVSRSGGRARFLFSCASERVHFFGVLERRTGSLFPPSSRYELHRFQPAEAGLVLERTLALAGINADAQLARALAEQLGQRGPILPADVQIAALAIRELTIPSAEVIERLGGAGELARTWLTAAAAATGNERSALRLLSELAAGDGTTPYAPAWAAARASLSPEFAQHALAVATEKGVVQPVVVSGTGTPHYALAHEILAPRIREVAAPARASARRAFELLGSKASRRKRLSLGEWRDLRREKISPSTPAEQAVIDRTRRTFITAAAVIAAVPIALLVIVYVMMSGSYYLAADGTGAQARVVVRAGRPGLGAFDWMPASPAFGSVVADTGVTPQMVDPKLWDAVKSHDITGDLGGDGYGAEAMRILRPGLRSLVKYAADGSENALANLRKGVKTPADLVSLLEALRPIARGGPQEVAAVEQALADASPAVQTAALSVATAVAERQPGSYTDTLTKALSSSDAELRRLAFSAVRSLDDKTRMSLYRNALASGPGGEARRELLAVVTASSGTAGPSAASAAAVLVNPAIRGPARQRARAELKRSFAADPARATAAIGKLLTDKNTPAADRVLVLHLLLESAPKSSYGSLAAPVRAALKDDNEDVRAAALPLFAHIKPDAAAGELAIMLKNQQLSSKMRVAMALGWGEVARSGTKAAEGALKQLIQDKDTDVRAAAARAYGNVGRAAQSKLADMVRKERFKVAVGAAYGLANSALAGGSGSRARGGIHHLWDKKGRSRRAAARVYATLARGMPRLVVHYLYKAIKDKDRSLHPIGVQGLCRAVKAGDTSARRYLVHAADDPSAAVRRMAIDCAADNANYPNMVIALAQRMLADPQASLRAKVASVLTVLAKAGQHPGKVGAALAKLAEDSTRDVRVRAIRALGDLGDKAPKGAAAALERAFSTADPGEKLVILHAAARTGAAELARIGLTDPSPLVRTAAIRTAIATNADVGSALSSALTDPAASVRRAALEELATGKHSIDAGVVAKALALAANDRDASISELALATLAKVGSPKQVVARLGRALKSRSERERARAAAAARGLAARAPKQTRLLLEPLLEDPSHDVRVAAVPALAVAYARTRSPAKLAQMLESSEDNATRRIAITAAFLDLAQSSKGGDKVKATLAGVAKAGAPLARNAARLGEGLLGASTNGVAFLQLMVP